jgi:transcriptional regulator of acetoin/glycerol metabolism
LLIAYPFPGTANCATSSARDGHRAAFIEAADLNLPSATRPTTARCGGAPAHREVLEQSGGNVSQAARVLGIDRVTLYNKIRKYHLRAPC